MDPVRFGRALGFGARHAAKTLTRAVDAATAENPSAKPAGRAGQGSPAPGTRAVAAGALSSQSGPAPLSGGTSRKAAKVVEQGRQTRQGLRKGSRQFRRAAWNPVVRLSGVVVLEVAGVFFGAFALYGLATAWKLRSDWHTGAPGQRQFLSGLLLLAVFGYFCVTSFLRARRRERGR